MRRKKPCALFLFTHNTLKTLSGFSQIMEDAADHSFFFVFNKSKFASICRSGVYREMTP